MEQLLHGLRWRINILVFHGLQDGLSHSRSHTSRHYPLQTTFGVDSEAPFAFLHGRRLLFQGLLLSAGNPADLTGAFGRRLRNQGMSQGKPCTCALCCGFFGTCFFFSPSLLPTLSRFFLVPSDSHGSAQSPAERRPSSWQWGLCTSRVGGRVILWSCFKEDKAKENIWLEPILRHSPTSLHDVSG